MQQNKASPGRKNKKQVNSNQELSQLERSIAPEKLETKQQSTPSSTRPVTPEQITKRAYEIWNERGRPSGCDLDHWVEAERELLGLDQKK
jgi:hypothetical protein